MASQVDTHARFGGVVPEIAAREHLTALPILFAQMQTQTELSMDDIDAIGVTQGPGLIGGLLVGISFARGLAYRYRKPLVPVDHIHAHVHGALLSTDEKISSSPDFPCLALVVSGGHTNLYLLRGYDEFYLLGSSIDDACGEAFDKVAQLLGLGYPGGPQIEKLARDGFLGAEKLPVMLNDKRLAFSYSGLKTAVSLLVKDKGESIQTHQVKANICTAFQEEALGQLVRKSKLALELFPECKGLIVAGGVAANQRFRLLMNQGFPRPCRFPDQKYCSDNAAMVAAYAYRKTQKQGSVPTPEISWDAYSRYDFAKYQTAQTT